MSKCTTFLGLIICLLMSFTEGLGQQLRALPVNYNLCTDMHRNADVHIKRGLLSLNPRNPSISPTEADLAFLTTLQEFPIQKRLLLAVCEFRLGILYRTRESTYSLPQMYSYLAYAYRLLGVETQKQNLLSSKDQEARKPLHVNYFRKSLSFYRLALKMERGEFKYTIAVNLVDTLIESGNLTMALNVIRKFERRRLEPSAPSGHGLIKLKADIYFELGKYGESGLSYEEWIRKGNVDFYLKPHDILYERLRKLRDQTGHPNNLPL